MKCSWVALLLLLLAACEQAAFEIDPTKVYSTAELVEKTQGTCNNKRPWDGKQVRVTGLVHQPAAGRFVLLDDQTRTPLTIIVAISDSTAMTQTMAFLQTNLSRKVIVTGMAKPEAVPTQGACRSTLFVWIDAQSAIER